MLHGFCVFFCVHDTAWTSWPGFTKCYTVMAREQYLALSKAWWSWSCLVYISEWDDDGNLHAESSDVSHHTGTDGRHRVFLIAFSFSFTLTVWNVPVLGLWVPVLFMVYRVGCTVFWLLFWLVIFLKLIMVRMGLPKVIFWELLEQNHIQAFTLSQASAI